jgi:hypothetical protein
MARSWTSYGDEWALPLVWIVGTIAAVGSCFYLMLFVLSQPTVYPNSGLAMATPSSGTRLIPVPRRSDAPALAETPVEPASPLTALAQAQAGEKPVNPETRTPMRKRARSALPYDPRRLGYAQQGIYENRDGSGTRAYSGGPKS